MVYTMTDADIGSLILAISKNGDLKKSLLMSKGDAQNCFYNKLELPHNDRECNRLGSLKGSTTTRVEHISVVSKPTDPELKIIYTQHENNNSDRPVGHWFISVCDTKNNQHHDIDSRNLNTQKDSISCGLHTVLNFILAKQELLKIASEPNGRDLSLARICNRIEKKLRDFNELFGIDQFYEANIPNKQVDFNDLGLGELLASVIISFNSESEVADKLQAELADSKYAAKLQAELADSEYAAKLQAELADSEYAAKSQAELADSEYAAKLEEELADSKYAAKLQAERADYECAVKLQEELAAKLQVERADSEYAAKLQAEFNNEDYV